MIDELIPDLSQPLLRRLYDVLLGREVPGQRDRALLVGVVIDGLEAERRGDRECHLPHPDVAAMIRCVIDRALCIDEEGVSARLRTYTSDALERAKKEVARDDRQV